MQSDEILKDEFEKTLAECERLRKENARLRLRLARFDWEPLSKIDCYRIEAETLLNKVKAVENE